MTIGSVLLSVGLLLLVGLFVARPLLSGREEGDNDERPDGRQALLAQKEALLTTIRDLDFDHDTGKIPDDEHHRRRTQLTLEAAAILEQLDEQVAGSRWQAASVAQAAGLPVGVAQAAGLPVAGEIQNPKSKIQNQVDAEIEAAVSRLRRASVDEEIEAAVSHLRQRPVAALATAPVANCRSSGAVNFCPQCGRRVDPQDRFCAYCGEKLDGRA
ncbi:MAG: zinc ribbon domain-containing protein [Chloroflexota bacterium]